MGALLAEPVQSAYRLPRHAGVAGVAHGPGLQHLDSFAGAAEGVQTEQGVRNVAQRFECPLDALEVIALAHRPSLWGRTGVSTFRCLVRQGFVDYDPRGPVGRRVSGAAGGLQAGRPEREVASVSNNVHGVREDRYEVDSGFALPDLGALAPKGGRGELESVQLQSSYFDTDERDLLRRGRMLRHQARPSDARWELIEATGDRAAEVRADPDDSAATVPAELVEVTTGLRRGRPLRRTVLVRTERATYHVVDSPGRVLLALTDDSMHAVVPAGEEAHFAGWREVAVETAGRGKSATRARAGSLLVRAGAAPSSRASVIPGALHEVMGTPDSDRRTKTAGGIVQRFITEQDEALLTGDLALRQGQDVIHPMRVATRRLRSTLRVFADYVDPARAAHLDAELAWLAELLGGVRDPDVQLARLAKAVADVPDHLVIGPVLARIERHLQDEKTARRAALDSAMSGSRHARLLRETGEWAACPPFTGKAAKKADALQTAVEAAAKKVSKSLRKGLRTGDEDELHRRARPESGHGTPLSSPTACSASGSGRASPATSASRTSWASTRTAWSPPISCEASPSAPVRSPARTVSPSDCSTRQNTG